MRLKDLNVVDCYAFTKPAPIVTGDRYLTKNRKHASRCALQSFKDKFESDIHYVYCFNIHGGTKTLEMRHLVRFSKRWHHYSVGVRFKVTDGGSLTEHGYIEDYELERHHHSDIFERPDKSNPHSDLNQSIWFSDN